MKNIGNVPLSKVGLHVSNSPDVGEGIQLLNAGSIVVIGGGLRARAVVWVYDDSDVEMGIAPRSRCPCQLPSWCESRATYA